MIFPWTSLQIRLFRCSNVFFASLRGASTATLFKRRFDAFGDDVDDDDDVIFCRRQDLSFISPFVSNISCVSRFLLHLKKTEFHQDCDVAKVCSASFYCSVAKWVTFYVLCNNQFVLLIQLTLFVIITDPLVQTKLGKHVFDALVSLSSMRTWKMKKEVLKTKNALTWTKVNVRKLP